MENSEKKNLGIQNKKRMNIAILDMDNLKNPHWAGGQARVTVEIGKRLVERHSITVYCSKYPSYEDYTENGIKYIHIGLGSKYARLNNIAYILILPFVVRKIKADIILENFTAPFATCFSPLFTKIPVVFLTSFFNPKALEKKYKIPFHIITKFGLKFYKYGIPLTKEQESEVKKNNNKINTMVISNGVDENYFDYPTAEKNYILYFGRIDINSKGIGLLLEAFSLVCNRVSEDLYIMGSGTQSEEAKMKKLIKIYGLEKHVKLLGRISGPEKERYVAESKFIVCSSRYESLGLSALESMALGKAVVCFDIPGFKWADNSICFKVEDISVEALAEKILEVSKNHEVRRNVAKKAREFARNYDWDKSAQLYESFFEQVLKNFVA